MSDKRISEGSSDESTQFSRDKKAELIQELPQLSHYITEILSGNTWHPNNNPKGETLEAVKKEINDALSNEKLVLLIVKKLFASNILKDKNLFDLLNDFYLSIASGEEIKNLTSEILHSALSQLEKNEAEELLNTLTKADNFFLSIEYLPKLLKKFELSTFFAAEWFVALLERIGNDLASGGFWDGLKSFCEHFPPKALEVIKFLPLERASQISVSAFLLGILRSLDLSSELKTEVQKQIEIFSKSPMPQDREVYHRSWIQTAWCGKMSVHELATLTNRMSKGTEEERAQIFSIVCKILLSPKGSVEFFSHGIEWLLDNLHSGLPAEIKYCMADFAVRVGKDHTDTAGKLIKRILPIPSEHQGTWGRIEYFLVDLSKRDPEEFRNIFSSLIEAEPQSWLQVLQSPNHFKYLETRVSKDEITSIISQLLFNQSQDCRQVGLNLFERFNLETLPLETLNSICENQVVLVFYELQQSVIFVGAKTQFLLLIVSLMGKFKKEFQEEIYNELVFQLKNYPSGCMKAFQQHSQSYPILQQAIDEVDKYFEQLKETANYEMTTMEVAGYRRASLLNAKKNSQEIAKGMKRGSSFMQLFKTVRLIYGKEWSTFHAGSLGESSELHEHSASFELPRMEFINPEGVFLRRMESLSKVRAINKEMQND